MSTTRREFLSQATVAAVMAGVGPAVASIVAGESRRSATQAAARPYLHHATRCAEWIDKSAQQTDDGLAWPADPLRPATVGLDYYNGMPGVVAFFANLAIATGDKKWQDRAD